MGPKNNPDLFQTVAEDTIKLVDAEFVRRGMVVPVLTDLAEQFDAKDNTPNPVTEPTLFARLYALSLVQMSRMGINGFDPMESFNFGRTVEAKAAVFHDEFKFQNNGTYRTRAIQFILPDQGLTRDINIFGLNIFQPGIEDDVEPIGANQSVTNSGIVVVDRRGAVTKKKVPVSGETVVFAVHNTRTNDAKVYQVTVEDASKTANQFNLERKPVSFENDDEASVFLPDDRKVIVKQLGGDLLSQVVNELDAAVRALRGLPDTDSILSEDEKRAAQETIFQTDISYEA